MRALAALGFVLAALASAKPQPGRPLLRSVTTPWVQWFDAARARDAAAVADPPPRHRALGKIKSSFQPSSRGDRAVGNLPRCNRRQFLNTTLPIFARECRSLLSDEGSAYGCSLSCARCDGPVACPVARASLLTHVAALCAVLSPSSAPQTMPSAWAWCWTTATSCAGPPIAPWPSTSRLPPTSPRSTRRPSPAAVRSPHTRGGRTSTRATPHSACGLTEHTHVTHSPPRL